MFPQTDKSLRDYRPLNLNLSYQPTSAAVQSLFGGALFSLWYSGGLWDRFGRIYSF